MCTYYTIEMRFTGLYRFVYLNVWFSYKKNVSIQCINAADTQRENKNFIQAGHLLSIHLQRYVYM